MHRMLPGLVLLIATFAAGCRNTYDAPRPYKVYSQKQAFFNSVINAKADSEKVITLKEDNYPISLRLYQDGRFSYTLRKLGDGWGKWKYSDSDGYIDLYAERTLFVMQMQIRNTDPADPKALALEFSDRFGPKYLKMETR